MRKICEIGRSMVEMLGVLAIIGVLSVGGIAGYSKAMTKFKLNKHTEQIGSILDGMHINLDTIKRSKTGIATTMMASVMIGMGLIPEEMIKNNNQIYDVFGNPITIYNYFDGNKYYFEFVTTLGQDNMQACLNLFQIAKLRSAMLYRTKFHFSQSDTNSSGNEVYGDAYCSDNVKCLKNFSLAEATDFCTICEDKDTCVFYIQMVL
ncbi:MAG: hypothetical protein E7016_01475 [Alphaproteobacteria bacterium]|nr:hypothetical protein [Alphaproteobacteria bacterium]